MDLTKNGKCSRCGQCCSNFIPLTPSELKGLQELVKGDVEVQLKTDDAGRVFMLCPFLLMNAVSNETRCSIYEHRPSICRFYKCDKPGKLDNIKHEPYIITDLMKDVIHYDYQKDNGMTYEEAMEYHMQKCKRDREEELKKAGVKDGKA